LCCPVAAGQTRVYSLAAPDRAGAPPRRRETTNGKARKGGKKKLKARKQSVKDLSASKTASVKGGVKRVRVD